jgi:hypothetical protein
MKKLNLLTLAIATGALLAAPSVIRAGIVGSPHDFSGESWSSRPGDPNTICSVCHTPHHADPNAGPLWNHSMSGGGFTMYNNANSPGANLAGSLQQDASPAASSLACLSCHDGTVAVNAYGGSAGDASTIITNSASLTKNLSHSHPISLTYDANLVGNGSQQDKWLYPPDSTTVQAPVNLGGAFVPGNNMTINGFLLGGNHRLECRSCHDVHNQEGSPFDLNNNPKLVKLVGTDASNNGSLLCRACHNK